MKLLLDESIPRKLAQHFPAEVEVRTVPQMDWAGVGNGRLLQLAASAGFNALITADKGIAYQQSSASLPLSVVVLRSYRTRLQDLSPLIPRVVELLESRSEVGVYSVAV